MLLHFRDPAKLKTRRVSFFRRFVSSLVQFLQITRIIRIEIRPDCYFVRRTTLAEWELSEFLQIFLPFSLAFSFLH